MRNFLASNALFWLDVYHIDGLRVDAVASMLYLDYARHAGEWIPNRFGGRENLEAHRIRQATERSTSTASIPDAQTIAEESTAWPMVSRPTYLGGLGFGLKWNMGWMHDTLRYFEQDPLHRKYHHNHLTFASVRLHRELRAAALARRSRARQGLAASARCPAMSGRSSPTCGCCIGYM